MTSFGFLSFTEPLWVYVSVPFAAAVLGWFTKIVAVKMIFYPVEFKGIRPYLGWQGQIPKHAAEDGRDRYRFGHLQGAHDRRSSSRE